MRKAPNLDIEAYRITEGDFASSFHHGNNGAFGIPHQDEKLKKRLYFLAIISSIGEWEHVSLTVRRLRDNQPDRIPTWEEMAFIKTVFFDDEETVVQYHPAKSNYVNCHPLTLHMWRPVELVLPTPPTWMIGLRPGQTKEEVDAEAEEAKQAWLAKQKEKSQK